MLGFDLGFDRRCLTRTGQATPAPPWMPPSTVHGPLMNNTTGSDIIPWRKAGAAQKDPSDPQAVTPIRFDRMHAMLQREEERVMRALVKQAVLLEESGAVRPELCRRFLRAYRAQARGDSSALLLDQGDPLTGTPAAGLLWGCFLGFVQVADAELRRAGLMRELGVLHGSLHAFMKVQQDLAQVGPPELRWTGQDRRDSLPATRAGQGGDAQGRSQTESGAGQGQHARGLRAARRPHGAPGPQEAEDPLRHCRAGGDGLNLHVLFVEPLPLACCKPGVGI